VHLGGGVQKTGRIDADDLVRERLLGLQDIREELRAVAATLITRGRTYLARGQVEHTPLEVELDDVLLVLSARLQVCIDGVEAVLRERRVAAEERLVEPGRAGDVAGAEERANAGLVARDLRAAAEIRL